MKTDFFLQKASNLFVENRLLKFAVGVMAIAVSFNSFMTYRAVKYQRTILIPPAMTGTVEFVQGKPSESYIKDISRRIVNLATSYAGKTDRILHQGYQQANRQPGYKLFSAHGQRAV